MPRSEVRLGSDRPKYNHEYYMRELLRPDLLRGVLSKATDFLGPLQFDAVAFCGNSGAILAPPLALALNREMILVRKFEINAHSRKTCEGHYAAKTYVIVDDFISSGKTVEYIQKEIKYWNNAECVGVLEATRLYYGKPNNFHTKFPWGRRS